MEDFALVFLVAYFLGVLSCLSTSVPKHKVKPMCGECARWRGAVMDAEQALETLKKRKP